jgi:hypothetical protein
MRGDTTAAWLSARHLEKSVEKTFLPDLPIENSLWLQSLLQRTWVFKKDDRRVSRTCEAGAVSPKSKDPVDKILEATQRWQR